MMKIGRLNSTYLVTQGDDFPRATRERFDAVAARLLPDAIARALNAAAAARDDHSVWIFRRLEFDVDLNPDRDDDSLAGLWANRLVNAVTSRIDDPTSDDVAHFKDQADLLRSYIADAAAGRPRKWYHNRFEGLDHLSTTARIRTALCLHAETGLNTLLRARPGDLRAIVGALSENDARRILDTLSPALPDSPEPFRALLDAWRDLGNPAPDGAGEFRWVLHMTIAARCRMSCARPVARLIRVLCDLDSATCGHVLRLHRKQLRRRSSRPHDAGGLCRHRTSPRHAVQSHRTLSRHAATAARTCPSGDILSSAQSSSSRSWTLCPCAIRFFDSGFC